MVRFTPFSCLLEDFCFSSFPHFLLFLKGLHSLAKLHVWDFEKCFRMKYYLSIQNTTRRFICCLLVPPAPLTSLIPNTFFFCFHFSSLCSRERLPTVFPQSHPAQYSIEKLMFSVSPLTDSRTFLNSHISDLCFQVSSSFLCPRYKIPIDNEWVDQE